MSLAALLFSLVIENVTLVDGTGRPPREGVTIVIDGDRVRSVSSRAEAPSATGTRIDGTGLWAIPGLMDMHVHLSGGIPRETSRTSRRFTRSSRPEPSSTGPRSRYPRME